MDDGAARHAPLESHADRFARTSEPGRPIIREQPFLTHIGIRVHPDAAAAIGVGERLGLALPTRPNTFVSAAGRDCLWLGPDEWLVTADTATGTDLIARLQATAESADLTVVDLSAARTTIELNGPAARDILEMGCSIDLHPRAFGPGSCVQTALARVEVILAHMSDEPGYRIMVPPSYAPYLADWLLDAVNGLRAAGRPPHHGERR